MRFSTMTFVFLIVCVLAVGWVIYLEHGTKKIIENLDPLPIATKERGSGSATMKTDPFSIDETLTVDTQDTRKIAEDSDTSDVHRINHFHDQEHPKGLHTSDEDNYKSKPNRKPYGAANSNTKKDLNVKRPEPFETLKKKLIEEHGDIPLVHVYIELRKKHLNREQMTMDEIDTYWEATMRFNPTDRNRKTYELIKRLSAQADYRSFEVIYDPKKLQEKREQPNEN